MQKITIPDLQSVAATFNCSDDLLWAALSNDLPKQGAIKIKNIGRIGPLVEIAYAKKKHPEAYCSVEFESGFADQVINALGANQISGADFNSKSGVFPVSCFNPDAEDQSVIDLWKSRAQSAATTAGFTSRFAAGLIGAMLELNSNIIEHSEHPTTGVLAYAAGRDTFEFVVADSGIGVLTGLRTNPEYSDLKDAGIALKVAATDGNSRFGSDSGRGFGIGNLFRALAGHNGELRFRSDDHVLSLTGDSPSLTGQVGIAHKARLSGLIISVICQTLR